MKEFLKNNMIVGIYFFIILYLEISFKLLTNSSIFNFSLFLIIIYSLFISFILSFISSIFKSKINKIILFIITILLCFLYSLEVCVYKIFGFYFNLSLLGATDQVFDFAKDGLVLVLKNILAILVLFLPIIVLIIMHKKIKIHQKSLIKDMLYLAVSLGLFLIFNVTLSIHKKEEYDLYYKVNNIELSIKRLGVLNTFFLDLERNMFNFEESIDLDIPEINYETSEEEENKEYEYNNLDIDFASLISKESNAKIKLMHEYFQEEKGTKQNEYTNYFKGKNLILFMAESFNEIAVDEKLTPTLYKLVNSGFVFPNFYTPTISSTIGGEFQELTGLVAANGFLSPWKKGENAYPFGLANSFNALGYNTYAYHDHSYTFQNRNKYLSALGFTNFKGCKNGLEKQINCNIWPESDVEMIEATFNDYINSDKPFMTYYVSVSGHGGYTFASNAMSRKHKEEVIDLPYSEGIKAYLGAQIELDKALELLIEKLSEAGKLDDTVIALVGDHYPYMLEVEQVNERSSYEKDAVIEINHSNFILWNNKLETTTISKVGSQIDVLPTIYNLFGVNYDSRLIIGKDILSTEPGLAIFGNRSWVSDYGKYEASSKKFTLKEGQEVDENYVATMNKIVANKVNMSSYILQYDYYKYFSYTRR